jgi:MinD-like ATPase involved in chromosome partitioning or flagellar assembly
MSAYWVTFYSYKGGVGRTLAMVNTAAYLVRKGKNVVLLDFDLEAPGLDEFDELKKVKGSPGIVEYVDEYIKTKKAPKIDSYVHDPRIENETFRGKLRIMPSGKKDESYNKKRENINWSALYEDFDGEMFVNNWKADIDQTFKPDYVFLDSRTGLTDVGGICTLGFPDLVVALFSLNNQNINGIAGVIKTISSTSLTPPKLLTVATPIPNVPMEKESLLMKRLEFAERKIGVERISNLIHYNPGFSLSEFIIDFTADESRAVFQYGSIGDKIVAHNSIGFDFLLNRFNSLIKKSDQEKAEQTIARINEEYPDRPEGLLAEARLHNFKREFGSYLEKLSEVVTRDPFNEEAFKELRLYLILKNKYKTLITVSDERYKKLKLHSSKPKQVEILRDFMEDCLSSAKTGNIEDYITAYELSKLVYKLSDVNKQRLALTKARKELKTRKSSENTLPKNADLNFNKLTALFEDGNCAGGLMPFLFNCSEITRKLPGDIQPYYKLNKLYIDIIFLYIIGKNKPMEIESILNRKQCMHIPYAMLGQIDQAKELLLEVQESLMSIDQDEELFCVATYQHISSNEFGSFNTKMLQSLDQNKLWDGTELKTASAKE